MEFSKLDYLFFDTPCITLFLQTLDKKCTDMSCAMKYNCCQQPDLCPKNKICIQMNFNAKPWKRFTCKCPDGYHGDNCDQPITSCAGYGNVNKESGVYKVVDSDNSIYEVYCHFDSDSVWTLVQSFSFENHIPANSKFKRPLKIDLPVSENAVTWSGYRLRKARMQLIKQNSNQLRFTCDFNNVQDVNQTDYLQISLKNLNKDISSSQGKINGIGLHGCTIKIHQNGNEALHVHTDNCNFRPSKQLCQGFRYFSFFQNRDCIEPTHRCTQNMQSTSQIWLGKKI